MNNIRILLGTPDQNVKSIGDFWIKSCLGICYGNFSVKELFTSKDPRFIQFIRRKLFNTDLEWIIAILDDETLVFSLVHNSILCWNIIPRNLSPLFLSSIFVNPEILKAFNDKYRLNCYQTSFNIFRKINDVLRKRELNTQDEFSCNSSLEGFLDPTTFSESFSQILIDFEKIQEEFVPQATTTEMRRFLTRIKTKKLYDHEVDFSLIDLLDLTPIHLLEYPPLELNIDKMRGQYFTPLELALTLVLRSFGHIKSEKINTIKEIKKLNILDPASGTGMIIIVALEWLTNQVLQLESKLPFDSFLQARTEIFFSSFTGFDIDDSILAFCKKFLRLFMNLTADRSRTLPNFQKKNYVEELTTNFQKTISQTRYDIILSNPPYIPLSGRFAQQVISHNTKQILQQMIPKFIGNRDNLYIIFLGLALRYSLSLSGGLVSFVIDHSFLDLSSYSEIRKTLLNENTLIYLLENYKYKRAVVDLSIIILKGYKGQDKTTMSFLGQKTLDFEAKKELISHFNDHPNFIYKIYRKAASRDILAQIDGKTIELGQISKISCGLEYGSLLKSHFLSRKPSKEAFRVIDGSNGLPQSYVTFWVPGMKNSFVRFSKEYEEYLRGNNLNRSKSGNKEVLLISGEKNRFTEPKIFLRQTASVFIVSYDTKEFFGLRNLHTIHKIQPPYSPYLIMGILTSTLGNWLGEELNIIRTTGSEGNRYPQIRIKDMNRFPVIDLEKFVVTAEVQRIKQLEVKVKENVQIGEKITTIYNETWEFVKAHTPEIPFRNQRRLFHFCRNPEKFSFLSKTAQLDLSFLLKKLQKLQSLLCQNQRIIDDTVFKIYGIEKNQWKELL
ncbi:MAG: Eco57I restriction-modification methylase domain-containing protein [Candidatus Hodarchaeales archaeon]|jgi:type I restriction-modification system DNA methylase subunit